MAQYSTLLSQRNRFLTRSIGCLGAATAIGYFGCFVYCSVKVVSIGLAIGAAGSGDTDKAIKRVEIFHDIGTYGTMIIGGGLMLFCFRRSYFNLRQAYRTQKQISKLIDNATSGKNSADFK